MDHRKTLGFRAKKWFCWQNVTKKILRVDFPLFKLMYRCKVPSSARWSKAFIFLRKALIFQREAPDYYLLKIFLFHCFPVYYLLKIFLFHGFRVPSPVRLVVAACGASATSEKNTPLEFWSMTQVAAAMRTCNLISLCALCDIAGFYSMWRIGRLPYMSSRGAFDVTQFSEHEYREANIFHT